MVDLRRRQRKWRPRRDWGRGFVLFLCAVFGFIGAVPLGLGLLVRTGPVRAWAARETEALLAQKLGVHARYDVTVQAWPMLVALQNVVVDASDGGTPFLSVERVAVRPRPFSLLAGHLDAGDVEIVGPRIRAVVENGALKNLTYHLPEAGPSSGGAGLPLSSLSITDARIDARIEGVAIAAHEVDADISSEGEGAFEIALRAGETDVTRVRAFPGRPDEDAVDDDVLCRLEARVRFQGRSILVRRLMLAGSADFDPDPNTRPACELRMTDWRAVELRLGALHVDLPRPGVKEESPRISGRVHARIPAGIIHRFRDMAHATGSIMADVEVDYDGIAPLPRVDGHIGADYPGVDGKVFGKRIDLDVAVGGTTVRASKLVAEWADGKVMIPEATIEPFVEGVPIATSPITLEGIEMTGLLRDLGAHPRAHVAWTLEKGRFEYMKGFLDPPFIEGPLTVQTHGFEIFDRPAVEPSRVHMMGVKEGTVRCTFVVNERERSRYKYRGVVLSNATIQTPKSRLEATVTLGTHRMGDIPNVLDIDVREGSKVDLSELSPLGDIPVQGVLSLKAAGRGRFDHPKLTGALSITDFDFAGLPVGDIEATRYAFEPLVLDMEGVRLRHGPSRVRSQNVRLAFANGATVVADADIDTREGPGLRFKDLFEVFHFDKDPRFADIEATARGKGRVHYALGGKEDRCGGGFLDVQTSMDLSDAVLLGERFEHGSLDAGLVWDDAPAGAAGMRLDLRSATLQKGDGSILLSATIRHGGYLRGTAVGSGIPLSKLDAFGAWGKSFDGTGSVVAELSGTLSSMELGADVSLSRVRIGPATLGQSRFHVGMTASPPPPAFREMPLCHNAKAGAFSQAEYDRDLTGGDVKIDGALFDGQVALEGLRVSRQRHKVVRGRVVAKQLDLGPIANLISGAGFGGAAPTGSLSATLDIKSLPTSAPQLGQLSLVLDALELDREGATAKLAGKTAAFELDQDKLTVPPIKIDLKSGSGFKATVVAKGSVQKATTAPELDLRIGFEPDVDLARIEADIPSVEHAAGTLKASLTLEGPVAALRYNGSARLQKGELSFKGVPLGLRDIDVDLAIADGEVRLTKAFARVGGGTVTAKGRAPLRGAELGGFSSSVLLRGVKVPAAEGVVFTGDADLEVTRRPGALADVKGTAEITQFSYTRPITLNLLNIGLSQIGLAHKPRVETYDPQNDLVHFSVNVVSAKSRPLRITNNLVDLDLEVMDPGLVLSGTNQRFGARGLLRILPDSKIQMRSNEFVVREGFVRFDDPQKIVPNVDVRAQTEYRRYVASGGPEQPSSGSAAAAAPESASGASAAASTSSAGVWRILFQARGEPDKLKVSLSSDPPLSQEDIVLLLALGLTRAEIDRAAATAALGQGLGLEALSTLTGADRAVKQIVPLIDEFRFGTGYSSRTASPEPTVTVGKRITDKIRASVTTGVSENREVRSNVEWRLNKRLSVQGSYDNLNDVSSSPLGNVGVDFRWRLDFE